MNTESDLEWFDNNYDKRFLEADALGPNEPTTTDTTHQSPPTSGS